MKKRLFSLFTMLCVLSFFTACSDDDKEDDSWKTISNTYKTESLVLNGTAEDASSSKSVKVDASSLEAATVVLNNIVIGQPEVSINAQMVKEGEKFLLTGSTKDDNSETSIEGSISTGVLTLKVAYKNTSAFVGTWALEGKDVASAPSNIYVNFSNASGKVIFGAGEVPNDVFVNFLKTIVGGYALNLTSVEFKENADIEIKYTDLKNKESKTLTGMLTYYIKDSKLYIVPNLAALMSKANNTGSMTDLLTNGIPMGYKLENGKLTVYTDKNMMNTVLPMVEPLLDTITDPMFATFKPMILQAITIIKECDTFDFGLNMAKQ